MKTVGNLGFMGFEKELGISRLGKLELR